MYRILFLGTPEFAVPSLRALATDERFEIVGVVTQPDRHVGRKGTITPPPIKVAAQELGIETIKQPEKLKDEEFITWIEEIGPTCDAFVVVAYGKIFRPWFLELPKKGLVNVHASLLPRWRGASPINAAIAEGDEKSGVSIMMIEEEMDAGPVLAMTETEIANNETAQTLHDRLSTMGADLLPMTLADYLEGKIKPTSQNQDLATYCKMITREDGKADWNEPAEVLERKLRAYTPWPGLWMEVDGKRIKILAADPIDQPGGKPGDRVSIHGEPAVICADQTVLILKEVQPENKPVMSGADFLKGNAWN
ncbi:methionyl-tRNA formyltransferase [Candidatus Uhrbacteria bacterium]|nr:methionyl-tRNA formyltransferase [Candidatus Uhrbacteria bacterium]MBD3284257.1 methionyl-tRNA formyltransferase [Candidatus Uhrbacteria bacterium]